MNRQMQQFGYGQGTPQAQGQWPPSSYHQSQGQPGAWPGMQQGSMSQSGQQGAAPVPFAPNGGNQLVPGTIHVHDSVEAMKRDISALNAKIEGLLGDKMPRRIQFPQQQKAGVIAYPDLEPFPFSWGEVELLENVGVPFATTGGVALGNARLNDIYSYLDAISFHMIRTNADAGLPNTLVNTWLPLSGHRQLTLTAAETYQGKDFRFALRSDATGWLWQDSWRSSSDIAPNTNQYVFPTEYNARPNDTITVSVQPLAGPVGTEAFRLFFVLHGYKMAVSPR